jgi:hypothetical protein
MLLCAGVVLTTTTGLAFAQQSPPADKLLSACEQQRNRASNESAVLMAANAQLSEDIAKLKAEIEKLKAGPAKK